MFWWGHLANIYFLEPNFMKSENLFLIWKIISFLCTLSGLHFLYWDCPPFFFLPYPPSASPFFPSETDRHFAGIIIGRHSHLSPVGNLPLSPFLFPLSLYFLPFRHHQERRRWWQWWRTRVGGKKVRLVAIDGDNQQLSQSLMAAVAEAPT